MNSFLVIVAVTVTVMDIAAVVVIIASFGYLEVIWPGRKPQTLSAPH